MVVDFKQAGLGDIQLVSSILTEAATWTAEKGDPLWSVDLFAAERIRASVAQGHFYLMFVKEVPAGVFKILDDDPEVWPEISPGESLFIHKVAVRRRFAGRGLLSSIITFAKERAVAHGRRYVRLDCETSRFKLRQLYLNEGFSWVSAWVVGDIRVSKFEMRVSADDQTCHGLYLPSHMVSRVDKAKFTRNGAGRSGDQVYQLSQEGQPSLYLKVETGDRDELRQEFMILNWLYEKLSVPRVMSWGRTASGRFLLMTEMKGSGAHEWDSFSVTLEKHLHRIGKAMRVFHACPIDACKIQIRLEDRLRLAKKRVERGLVDEEDFASERVGKSAVEVYAAVSSKIPDESNFVFTHGDFCLPNLIFDDAGSPSFIDLGRAGIADAYQDLALCYRSIRSNFGKDAPFQAFFDGYGLPYVDYEKIDYYICLDELF